jgi:hypothetical protein
VRRAARPLYGCAGERVAAIISTFQISKSAVEFSKNPVMSKSTKIVRVYISKNYPIQLNLMINPKSILFKVQNLVPIRDIFRLQASVK